MAKEKINANKAEEIAVDDLKNHYKISDKLEPQSTSLEEGYWKVEIKCTDEKEMMNRSDIVEYNIGLDGEILKRRKPIHH